MLKIQSQSSLPSASRPLKRRRDAASDNALPPAKRIMLQASRPKRGAGLATPTSLGALAPMHALELLLCTHYLDPDEALSKGAADLLDRLQAKPELGHALWHEAVATALMAQGRHGEAGPHYDALAACGAPFPQRTVLTAARFFWPFDAALSQDVSSDILAQAVLGAAAAGNLLGLQDLQAAGASLTAPVRCITASAVAAHFKRQNILTFLQNEGSGG